MKNRKFVFRAELQEFKKKEGQIMNKENLIQLIYDDLQEMIKQQKLMNDRLNGMDKRFESIDKRFESIDKRFENIDKRFESIDKRFENIDKRFDHLETKVLENTAEIKKINLCIENEIRPSIMRIAEAHLDLNRKLDEALKIDQQKEKMALRLNFLEGRMDRLEAKAVGPA